MKKSILTIIAICIASAMQAKVEFAPHLTSHMVLQQNSEVTLRGTAKAGKVVTVITSWNGAEVTTIAAEDGKWSAKIATPSYGGPYSITAKDGKRSITTLEDILIGDVWLCTGQSNMELSMKDKIVKMDELIASADNFPSIRLLHVENAIGMKQKVEVQVRNDEWKVCSSESVKDFSAVGYLYGKELNEKVNIPIGLVMDCWGGTVAEAWTSEDYLRDMSCFDSTLNIMATLPDDKEECLKVFEQNMLEWNSEMMKLEDRFDPVGVKAMVPGFLEQQGVKGVMGYSHMKKTIEIPAEWEGKELTLKVGAVDDNDCTFYNGVYLGHTESCIRTSIYTVPAELVKAGKAVIDVRMMNTGGLSGILGSEENIRIEAADGSFISLVGEWDYHIGPTTGTCPHFPIDPINDLNTPSGLYNAMIHPMIQFPVAGAIWYQGESNAALPDQYRELLPMMIANWRSDWGQDFPFYICQIASYMDVQEGPEDCDWARLRESQAHTAATVKNCGLAVLIDVGEARDIHPRNKIAPAHRLALNALAKTYGHDVEYSGPVYSGYVLDGSKMILSFDHATGGLVAAKYGLEGNTPESELKGFYIAGPDHEFHPAKAEIVGDKIVVSSEKVRCPVSVRYAWANNPVCNLYNGVGLPAVPFRTDSWKYNE